MARDAVVVALVATITVLATGIGALPVLAAGEAAGRLRPWLDGLVIGVMGVAAVAGLLIPSAQEGGPLEVTAGCVLGAGGLWWARRVVHARVQRGGHGRSEAQAQLTFGVLLVHSLPEGLALGSAMAASGSLAAFVVVAVAIQNIPEGTATAIALLRAGRSGAEQVGAALLTSVPQIPGALLAWGAVDIVSEVLPASLAAAGAAMLLLVCVDLVPAGWASGSRRLVVSGTVGGALLMGAIAVALNPPA